MRDMLTAAAALLLLAACSNNTASTTQPEPADNDLKTDNAPAEIPNIPSDAMSTAEGPAFSCFGAGPYWSAKIDGGALTLRSPLLPDPDGAIFSGEWEDASSDANLIWKADDDGRMLTIERESCIADSGNEHAYRTNVAAFLSGADSAEGCCNLSENDK